MKNKFSIIYIINLNSRFSRFSKRKFKKVLKRKTKFEKLDFQKILKVRVSG